MRARDRELGMDREISLTLTVGFSVPGSPLASDVVRALVPNQSAPALELLRATLADPAHAQAARTAWARNILLPRRNDAPLLVACEELVASAPEEPLRIALVEAHGWALRSITQSASKSDRTDAEQLARLGRADPRLLRPIQQRGEQAPSA